jgi:uncharacterized protein (TIGR02453 family)
MAATIDLAPALSFIGSLAKNNNRDWFEAHRDQYEAAMESFQAFVARLIDGMAAFEDLGGLTAKKSVMRIYRDIRFSKDKTPYKDGFGARMMPGGRGAGWFGYYVHLQPGNQSMLASGMYDSTPQQLSRYRAAVAADPKPLRKIIAAPAFRKHFGELWGEVLKTTPKGYPPDHPAIDLLRRKQVCVTEPFKDSAVAAASFTKQALESFKTMKPFLDWLNDAAAD